MAKHISSLVEWDEMTHIACSVYNFLLNEHSREAPFFLMFSRDPRIPLNDLLRPWIRYLGMDEMILSLQAMRNIYKMFTQNLKTVHACLEKETTKFPTRVKTEDLKMLKRHDKKTFEPTYEGYFHVLKLRGNQVDVQPTSGGQVKTVHIKDVKVILLVDWVLNEIPDYINYGRKSKLDLDPNKNWALSTRILTYNTPTTTVSTPS